MLNFNYEISNDDLDCNNVYSYLEFSIKDYIDNVLNFYPDSAFFQNKDHLIKKSFNIYSSLKNLSLIKNSLLEKNLHLVFEDDFGVIFICNDCNLVIKLDYSNNYIYCVCTYFSSIEERFLKLKEEILKFNQPQKNESNFIYSFCQNTGYPAEIKKVGQINSIFCPENYSAETAESYPILIEKLSSSNPGGRLLVLDGPPGTGKTYFIRSLISSTANENTIFILLDYSSASSVSGAELLNVLLKFKQSLNSKKSLTFIIEDADHFLHSRDDNNMKVISSLLNLTDGMLGEALDIRVIASTNIPLDNIETALIRPGRLMKRLSFSALEPQRAYDLYKKLTGKEKEFSQPISLCEIYAEINR